MCWPRLPPDSMTRAAWLARNGLRFRRRVEATPSTMSAQRVYHNPLYRLCIASVVLLPYLALIIWEPPVSNAPDGLGLSFVRAIDWICICIISGDLLLQRQALGARVWARRGWVRVKLAATALIVANLIAVLVTPSLPYVARCLRPLLVLERLRNVRRVATNVALTLPKLMPALILVTFHVILFAVLGNVLFAGVEGAQLDSCTVRHRADPPICSAFTTQCSDYFASIETSCMQLAALLTTANFPTVALPAYSCWSWSMLYFAAFIIVGIYCLLSLTLATAFSTFKALLAREVRLKYERMFAGIDAAFDMVADTSRSSSGSSHSALSAAAANPLHSVAVPADGVAEMATRSPLSTLKDDAGIPDWEGPARKQHLASRPTPDTDPGPGMTLHQFLTFYAQLRPDVAPDFARKLFHVCACAPAQAEAADGDRDTTTSAPCLSRVGFRRLLLHFARLRVVKIRPLAGTGTGTVQCALGSLAHTSAGPATFTESTPAALPDSDGISTAAAPRQRQASFAAAVADMVTSAVGLGTRDGDSAALFVESSGMDDEDAQTEAEAGLAVDVQLFVPTAAPTPASALAPAPVPAPVPACPSAVQEPKLPRGPVAVRNPLAAVVLASVVTPSRSSSAAVGSPSDSDSARWQSPLIELPAMGTLKREPTRSADPAAPPLAPIDAHRQSSGHISDGSSGIGQPRESGEVDDAVDTHPTDDVNSARTTTAAIQLLASTLEAAFSTQTTPDGLGVTSAELRSRLPRAVRPSDGIVPTATGGGATPKGWGTARFRRRLARCCASAWSNAFFDVAILVNSIAVLVQLSSNVDGNRDERTFAITRNIQLAMLALFILEIAGKLLALGPTAFWRPVINRIDLLLVGAAVASAAVDITGVADATLTSALSFARFVRLARVLRIIPGFGLTLASFGDIAAVLLQYGAVLFLSFYVFAVVGTMSFAGQLSPLNPQLAGSAYTVNGYNVGNMAELPASAGRI